MITVQKVIDSLPVKAVAGSDFSKKITGGYVSDLLSNVMGQAKADSVWITMQIHQNVAAVSLLAGLSAVIIAGGMKPDKALIDKANEEDLAILVTDEPTYEITGRLYELGIK